MTVVLWCLVDAVSRFLNERDREVVLGDLAESGETPWQGFCGIASLLLRREAAHWPSWMAALVLSVPGGLLLAGFSLTVSQAYNRTFFHASGLSAAPGHFLLLCNILILVAWRWSGATVLGSLSRRAVWLSAALAFAPCAFCITRFDLEATSRLSLLLLLLPAILSAVRGQPLARMGLRPAIAFAAGVTVLTIPAWTNHGLWFPNWALSWPAWYLVGTAQRGSKYASE
jgi:hypothetical protein